MMTRAHSLPWTVEFRAELRNLGFYHWIEPWNSSFSCRMSAEFDVFHSNNFFNRKWPQSSSVTSLFTL